MKHFAGAQSSLGNANGLSRYTRTGLLTIQLFTPQGDGLALADTISTAFEEGVRGKRTLNGVIYKNVSSQEIGIDGPWFQTNINADFEYDQVG